MKKILFSTLFALAATAQLTLPATAAIHSKVPQDVQQFAEQKGLAEAKKLLSLAPGDIGFSNSEEVNALVLGPGLQTYHIDVEKFNKSHAGSFMSVITPNQEWEFLLQKNDRPVTSLTIIKDKNEFFLKGVGGSSDHIKSAWSQFDSYTVSKVEPALVIDRGIRYFVGTFENREIAVPDLFGNPSMNLKNIASQQVVPASDIMRALKDFDEEIRKNQSQAGELLFGSSGITAEQKTSKNTWTTPLTIAIGILSVLGISFFALRKKIS
ncbi:MAG: hypothetical protein WCC10_03910 [Tumebacillaceae bacterium]